MKQINLENYVLVLEGLMSFYAKDSLGKSGTANLWIAKDSLNFVTFQPYLFLFKFIECMCVHNFKFKS